MRGQHRPSNRCNSITHPSNRCSSSTHSDSCDTEDVDIREQHTPSITPSDLCTGQDVHVKEGAQPIRGHAQGLVTVRQFSRSYNPFWVRTSRRGVSIQCKDKDLFECKLDLLAINEISLNEDVDAKEVLSREVQERDNFDF